MPRVLNQNSLSNSQQAALDQFYLSGQLPAYLRQRANQHSQITEEDLPNCKNLLQQLSQRQIKNTSHITSLSSFIQSQEGFEKGMGYFAAKDLLLLQYLINLKLYELYKVTGHSVSQASGAQLYHDLAYFKALMLKLSPVEKKLDYQKTKILRLAQKAVVLTDKKKAVNQQQSQIQQERSRPQPFSEQNSSQASEKQQQLEKEQMAFKPRPAALLKVKKEKDIKLQNNQKYEAPKISSALSRDQKLRQKMQKQKERRRLGLIRRLQSDLQEGERAQETFLGDEVNQKLKKKFQQKIAYEEEAFVRLPENKKDKYYRRQLMRNYMRKNQLQEDFKEVQMVRQLFDQQKEMQNKIITQKKNKKVIQHPKKYRKVKKIHK